jgi:hypothetical protein
MAAWRVAGKDTDAEVEVARLVTQKLEPSFRRNAGTLSERLGVREANRRDRREHTRCAPQIDAEFHFSPPDVHHFFGREMRVCNTTKRQ